MIFDIEHDCINHLWSNSAGVSSRVLNHQSVQLFLRNRKHWFEWPVSMTPFVASPVFIAHTKVFVDTTKLTRVRLNICTITYGDAIRCIQIRHLVSKITIKLSSRSFCLFLNISILSKMSLSRPNVFNNDIMQWFNWVNTNLLTEELASTFFSWSKIINRGIWSSSMFTHNSKHRSSL